MLGGGKVLFPRGMMPIGDERQYIDSFDYAKGVTIVISFI
jgi:hypothetical protein